MQRTGFVSVNTRFQIPPKKKSHVERSVERGGHGTSPKREMRCPGNLFRTMVIDSFAVCAWHHLVETTHWHGFFFFGAVPPSPHPRLPTEYQPFKRCQVPVGNPVHLQPIRILSDRRVWVIRATPWPFYTREETGTHHAGGWLGLGAGLERQQKPRPQRNSILGQNIPKPIAIPT